MLVINNPFGEDPAEFNEATEAKRIGNRIKEIRAAAGMSQSELGEKVGLTGDRIQKYENGARRPKIALLKSIAAALGVETLALTDPVVVSYLGAMYAFFEMESVYSLKPEKINGKLYLIAGDGKTGELNKYIDEWYLREQAYTADLAATQDKKERLRIVKEYSNWEKTFPRAIVERTERHLMEQRKAQLEEQIAKLKRELSDMENG